MKKEFSESIMQRLRQRADLNENDTSKDEELNSFSPRKAVRECVAWELGDPDWVDTIARLMVDAGSKPEDF